MTKPSIDAQLTSLTIQVVTERLRNLVDSAHAGRPIEIDGITYVRADQQHA